MFVLGALVPHAASRVSRLSMRDTLVLLLCGYLVLGFSRGILGYGSKWSLLCE